MLQQIRKIEKELKIQPVSLDLFPEDMIERAKAIRCYLLSIKDIAVANGITVQEPFTGRKNNA